MALLTPVALTQIWNVTHGLSSWFRNGFDIQLAPGALLRCGVAQQAGPNDLGCTLIIYDTATGEPTDFVSHIMVNVDDEEFIGAYHFPAENAVALFAASIPSIGTDVEVYGQRIEYDLGAVTITPGLLATWSGFNTGTNDLLTFHADVPDSDTINVFGWGPFSAGMTTLNLTAGTDSGRTDYTVDDIVGGGLDRFNLSSGAVHGPGVLLLTAYLDALGPTTAVTFLVTFSATPSSATNLGLGRLTSSGNPSPLGPSATVLIDAAFDFGANGDYLLTTSGLTALPAAEVRTNVAVYASTPRSTVTTDPTLASFNREGPTFNAFNDLIARRYNPVTAQELGAWEYPGNYTDFGLVGMLSPNRRFWWGDFTTQFRVYEAPVDDTWFVGFVGANT